MTDASSLRAVGDEHECRARLTTQFPEQLEDVGSVPRIEVSGGFIGQKKLRPMRQGPGDGHPLHLTAGQLRGAGLRTMADLDPFEQVPHPLHPLRRGHTVQLERQLDILSGSEGRKQMEELEDGPQPTSTDGREGIAVEGVERHPTKFNPASVGSIDPTQAVQQRGLATAGRSREREAFPSAELEGDILKHDTPGVGPTHADGSEQDGCWSVRGGRRHATGPL